MTSAQCSYLPPKADMGRRFMSTRPSDRRAHGFAKGGFPQRSARGRSLRPLRHHRSAVFVLQQSGGPFAYDDAGRHGVPGRHSRHDGGVGNSEAQYAVDLESGVDDRHSVASHLRRAALMPERDQAVAYELLQRGSVQLSGRNLAPRVRAKGRRIADLTRSGDANSPILQVERVGEIVRLNVERIERVRAGQMNDAPARGPHADK